MPVAPIAKIRSRGHQWSGSQTGFQNVQLSQLFSFRLQPGTGRNSPNFAILKVGRRCSKCLGGVFASENCADPACIGIGGVQTPYISGSQTNVYWAYSYPRKTSKLARARSAPKKFLGSCQNWLTPRHRPRRFGERGSFGPRYSSGIFGPTPPKAKFQKNPGPAIAKNVQLSQQSSTKFSMFRDPLQCAAATASLQCSQPPVSGFAFLFRVYRVRSLRRLQSPPFFTQDRGVPPCPSCKNK